MSYEIVYDRRFICTTRGIIPLTLHGSNNCYDLQWDSCGRQREVRERHWSVFQESMIEDSDAQIRWVDACASNPEAQLFMNNGKWIYGKQIRKWFQNGIDTAKTLEEYLALNPGVAFLCMLNITGKGVCPDGTEGSVQSETMRCYIRTTPELETWLDNAKEYKEDWLQKNPKSHVYLHMAFDTTKPLKVLPAVKGKVVAKWNVRYVKSYQKGKQLEFTEDPALAKVFDSPEHAYSEMGTGWKKIRLVSAASAVKPKPWVIRIVGGSRNGNYVQKVTKQTLRSNPFVASAARYPTEGAARTRALAISQKFSSLHTTKFMLCNTADDNEILFDASQKTDERSRA